MYGCCRVDTSNPANGLPSRCWYARHQSEELLIGCGFRRQSAYLVQQSGLETLRCLHMLYSQGIFRVRPV
jgi:hypothetical protein